METINRMIDYVHDGNRLFYDIYSEAEKRAGPHKNDTGLFFFRGGAGTAVRHCLSGRRLVVSSGQSTRDFRSPLP